MATYITTLKFTQQGIQDVGQTTKRAGAFKAAAKKMGVKVKELYWTLGDYDGAIVFEADDDAAATAAMLHLSSRGNVQTKTCRAFTAGEMDQVLGKLPAR